MTRKYKVGDIVWIKSDIPLGSYQDTGQHFQINSGEIDIRGKQVQITNYSPNDLCYNCEGYRHFHELMIDEVKTKNNTPQYEIY